MSLNCFEIEHLLIKIVMYLNPKEIISFLSSNKTIYKILRPATNPTTNTIFYFYTYQKFFEMTENPEKIKYNKNKKYLLDSYWRSSINWKLYLSQITSHFKLYPDKNISNLVLKAFQIHMYLPQLRKENIHLEFTNSSIHQLVSYDKNYLENCQDNFYNKVINDDYIINNGKNEEEIKVLKNNLPYEEEFKDFFSVYKEIKSNDEYKDVIKYIIKYDFEKIEQIFKNVKNNTNNKINKIIYFILWLNESLIMYSKYTYESIIKYENDKDEKKFLLDYINKYNDYINASLLIDSYFQNVNIIMNYLNKYILNNTKSNKFSIYKLARKIFKKNVFKKVFQTLDKKYSVLVAKYNNKKLDNNNEDEIVTENEDVDNYDDIIMENEDFEDTNDSSDNNCLDESFSSFNNEKSEKDIIEIVTNSALDMDIDQNNANGINHTNIKLSKNYEQFENTLISNVSETIKQKLNEGKSASEIYEIAEKYFGSDKNHYKNLLKNTNSPNFINRTKKAMLQTSFQTLCEYILPKIVKDFSSRLRTNMNQRQLYINNNEVINKNEYKCDLSDFSNEKIMEIENKVQQEINNVKTCLYEQNIKGYKIEETVKLVNEYMDNDGIELVLLVKKMIYFYFKELAYYEEKNKKVVEILTGKGNLDINCFKL